MRTVLGIDAAWTETKPSGVALAKEEKAGWRCIAVAPSYSEFVALSEKIPVDWSRREPPCGSKPNVRLVLEAARVMAGAPVELIAIDMPISEVPISSRRIADNAVSQEFGRRLCSAHSPNSARPGKLGRLMTDELAEAGYPISTKAISSPRSLIEVYPHPALLSLLNRESRIPYKVSKSKKYWRNDDIPTRIRNLLYEFTSIQSALELQLGPLDIVLPDPRTTTRLSSLKRYEDALDALVCAWVGIEHLLGRTTPLGNDDAAIWCPTNVIRGLKNS